MLEVEISEYLQANDQGTRGTDLFRAEAPDMPDTVVVVWEYPGSTPQHVKNQSAPVQYRPRFQVSVRAKSHDAALLRAWRIFEILVGFSGFLSGVHYQQIRGLQNPARLPGRDDKGRVWVTCNYEAKKEASPIPTT